MVSELAVGMSRLEPAVDNVLNHSNMVSIEVGHCSGSPDANDVIWRKLSALVRVPKMEKEVSASSAQKIIIISCHLMQRRRRRGRRINLHLLDCF